MGITRTIGPVEQVVGLDELKRQCRISLSSNTEDVLLEQMLSAAVAFVEADSEQQLIDATFAETFWGFENPIRLSRAPVSSVTSVEYIDTAGDTQTLASSVYHPRVDKKPGELWRAVGEAWPTVQKQFDAVTVTYVAGYGTTPADVPAQLRQAILLVAANLYKYRETTVSNQIIRSVRGTLDIMLDPFKLRTFS